MKKLFCALLVLCLALVCVAFGEEKPIETVIYGKVKSSTGGAVSIYQLPGEYRPVVTTLADGTSVYVEFEGSTWHKIRTTSGGNVGWIKASELTITSRGLSALNYGCTITGTKTVQSSDGFAVLRWGPGLEYDEMAQLPTGTVVWQYDRCDDWARVLTSDGRIGYVYGTLLKNASANAAAFPTNLYGYVQVTGNSAIYRQSASYSSKSLGTMPSGEIVEIIGESSGFWYFHSASRNVYAYISKDIVSPEGLNRVANYTMVYYDNPYLYPTDALCDVQPGQVVKILANDGYICRVQYNKIIGYVVATDLAFHH